MNHTPPKQVFHGMDRTMAYYELVEGEGSEPHQHEYEHDLYVAKGKVQLNLNPIFKVLGPGDTVRFQAHAPHGFVALEPSVVITLHPKLD